jgi:pimeloyl-ACP methyl ester carboxylesterase
MEVRERVETLGDLWLWVAEAGPSEAPPILLLHGLYDRWETWEPVVPALAERFRVIAFDMRGHGRSSQPAGGYTLRDYADDAVRLLARLRPSRPVVVIGFSLGALVAIVLAAEHPELIRGVVLVDPPLVEPDEGTRLWLRALLEAKRAGIEAAYELARELDPDGTPEEWQQSALWLCSTADGPILALLDEGRRPDPWELLPNLSQPVLVLQADPVFGGVLDDETAQRALAQLRQGELVAMPGCGHAIHRTCPDDFLEVVLEFLARLDRPATGEYVGLEHPAG